MKIRVRCYAGHRGEEEPRAFDLGDRNIEVMQIIDRWLSPDHRYFKVHADDGRGGRRVGDDVVQPATVSSYHRVLGGSAWLPRTAATR